MLKQFTRLELTLANYFGPTGTRTAVQTVHYRDVHTGQPASINLPFEHFNVETDRFPYPDGVFDVVLFCELLEHLLVDPVAALREINRVLRPGGVLILTTPNVNRLENVARMIAGLNVYARYSAHGPYGRHNREYARHELHALLDHAGFAVDQVFTADSIPSRAYEFADPATYAALVRSRQADLGQYLFFRAVRCRRADARKLHFLYQGYSASELV
jgi:SAM-dependent methyltransferase